ncbi:MAG TPA: hypothetical protein PLN63_00865 [Paludibacteraceae bacterium]|nr:hypothetical protein [Paludibacteraceae bacterium]HPH62164.1 hypothetical protein [Paludibacteraceae bacterium]
MKRGCFSLLLFLLSFSTLTWADIEVSNIYLQNSGFDDNAHFDYRISDNGNVAQEILPVFGWTKDIGVDYTVSGVYELGTAKTFNTYGKVPSKGYDGKSGGCLALSTGWDQPMKYYQTVTLPAGEYKLQTAFYNGSNSNEGYSLLAWIPQGGDEKASSVSSFPSNQWLLDEVNFTLSKETTGRIQIGFKAVSGGSANSAKVVADFVKLYLVGDDNSLISKARTTLENSISSAQQAYGDGSGKESAALKFVIDEAQTIADNASASYVDLFNANEAVKQGVEKYEWANSTVNNPSDFTQFIVNPSFEDGFNGWQQSGLQLQNNNSFSLKAGNYYVEKWVESGDIIGDVSLKQELSKDLPQGVYILKVSAQNLKNDASGQQGAWIFAGNDSTKVSEKEDYTLQIIHIEETLPIGFCTVSPTGNWVALDNFRLYYAAATIDDYKTEMTKRIEDANDLLDNKMNVVHRKSLQSALELAESWNNSPSKQDLPSVASKLRKAMETAITSAAAFSQLAVSIAEADSIVNAGENDSDLVSALNKAKTVYNDESQTIADINAQIDLLEDALLIYRTNNATGPVPVVETDPRHARGATMAFGRASFSGSGITEKGFCWGTRNNPTIRDNRSTIAFSNNGDIYVIEGMQPSTIYYIRPYAITNQNAVGYGKTIKICTLPMGNITWSYNNGGSADENTRINSAVKDACDIWNNITSISGLKLTVNYGADTPTADCSYGGWMRVGPNASYQRTGTIQHEMEHAAGVGTTERWYNDATYRQNTSTGFWLGERTDQVVQFLENDNTAHLKGDNTHFWPYGINGAQEDDGTRMLYYANALIVQALGEDFLPPVSGAFASPAYTFIQDDNEYYYLLSASNVSGNNYTILKSNGGNVELQVKDLKSLLNDLSYAWQVRFNPVKQLYEFKNIASEKALANNSSLVQLTDNENFGVQMLGSREKVVNSDFNLKSYWLTFADGTERPNTLTASNNTLAASRFDHRNSSTNQRWILLSRQELKALVGDYTEVKEASADNRSLIVYGVTDRIIVESTDKGEWVIVCDILGRKVKEFYMQAGMQVELTLAKGIYLVNGHKVVCK